MNDILTSNLVFSFFVICPIVLVRQEEGNSKTRKRPRPSSWHPNQSRPFSSHLFIHSFLFPFHSIRHPTETAETFVCCILTKTIPTIWLKCFEGETSSRSKTKPAYEARCDNFFHDELWDRWDERGSKRRKGRRNERINKQGTKRTNTTRVLNSPS